MWRRSLPRRGPRWGVRGSTRSAAVRSLVSVDPPLSLRVSTILHPLPKRSFSTAAAVVEGFEADPRRAGIRNIAVVAHVDHGKTTLVDQLLKAASGTEVSERLMDSGDLEKERGITITSKVTRLEYNDLVINCVDTPGHADFCGEVDRILSMVDGVVLVVDAAEGPKPQTKYVTQRALVERGLPLVVVLNKCDRPDGLAKVDSGETEDRVHQLLDSLGVGDREFSIMYASAKSGWVTEDPLEALELAEDASLSSAGMSPLLDKIAAEIPEPRIHTSNGSVDDSSIDADAFSLAAVSVGYDQFLGRTCTGRVASGCVKGGDKVVVLPRSATDSTSLSAASSISGVFIYKGIERVPLEGVARAGDIVTLAGVPQTIAVGDTLCKGDNPISKPLETPPLAPPTLSMDFGANNGPLAGKEGTQIASSKIKHRLVAETDNNVTLNVATHETDKEKSVVLARGELQLGILIEQMRREGFEMVIAPPRIVTTVCSETGKELEPFEEVTVDVDTEYSGSIVSALTGDRKGSLLEMTESASDSKTRMVFEVPTRGLLGFHSEVATLTRGSAVVTHLFLDNREHAGSLGAGLDKSKLVSNTGGKATAYALSSLAARGVLFIEPGDDVYSGMVIGECSKTGPDLEVNPVKAKDVSNMRTTAKDEKVVLPPPKRMALEELIGTWPIYESGSHGCWFDDEGTN